MLFSILLTLCTVMNCSLSLINNCHLSPKARNDLKMAIADDDTEVLENALSEYRAFGDDGKSRQPRDNSEGLLLPACHKLHGMHHQGKLQCTPSCAMNMQISACSNA